MEVAYQTSGSIAVSDEEALRFSEFATQYHSTLGLPSSESAAALGRIRESLGSKRPGQVILNVLCFSEPPKSPLIVTHPLVQLLGRWLLARSTLSGKP